MADTNNDLNDQVRAELVTQMANLHKAHFTLSGTTALVAIVVVSIGAWFVHRALVSYDQQLAKANQQNVAFLESMKQFQAELAASTQLRASNDSQIQVIHDTQVLHDQAVQQQVMQVTAPNQTSEQVVTNSEKILGVAPTIEKDGNYGFNTPATEQFMADKLQLTAAQQKLVDDDHALALEKNNADLLQADLGHCQTELKASEKNTESYKKVAVKSKWRKTVDIMEKVGLAAGGILLGHGLTKLVF